MSDTLFDLSQYKSASAKSYHSDYIDATGTDPAWDEPSLAAIPALGMDELATEVADHWQSCAEFTITLASGQTVQGIFLPGLEGELRMHQFDFTGSVSSTGFKSHFVLAVEAEKFSHPCDYAQAYVPDLVAWFEAEQQQAKSKKRSRSVAKAQVTQGQATENDDSRQETIMAEDKTPELNHATVEVVEELSEQEEAERHRLELKVERAFAEAGFALRELRQRRLYRSTHKTFEEYCQDRFRFSRQSANYLIAAAAVVENLTTNGCQIVPTSERQVRPLTKLDPDQQYQIWEEAVEACDGKLPSGRMIKSLVERLTERGAAPPDIPFQAGDVVLIRGAGNPDLRKYDGHWAIALRINEYTIGVALDGKEIVVKPQFLEEVGPEYWVEIKAVNERITRLQLEHNLDAAEDAVLEVLRRRTSFTSKQMTLLAFLEQQYGIC